MSSNEIDSALLDRYLAGELSEEENRYVEEILARNPAEKRRVLGIRSRAAERFGPIPPYSVDARVASIVDFSKRSARRIHEEAGAYRILAGQEYAQQTLSLPPPAAAQERKGWKSGYLYIAAACAFAVCVAVLGLIGDWRFSGDTASDSFSVYTTNPGERATITLPDSSRVILNVASRLEVPVDYGKQNRTLRLDGEAHFTVTQSAGDPFTIIAGPSTTRVLGTRFMVRHYSSDSVAIVAVEDGKVSVQSQTLTAWQQVYVPVNGQARLMEANAGQFTFASGVLTLEDQPLPHAIEDLNRWYNADIRLGNDSLKERFILGEFATGSISDLMEILELTLNVRVERNGRTLTLY